MSNLLLLQSFKRGAWTAHVIETQGIYRLIRKVRLDQPNGNTQWPAQYHDGRIGYDQDAIPRDAQRAAQAAYTWLAANTIKEY